MYVRNVAGYNFAFKYRGNVIYIPCDGQIYSIPDDCGKYRELKIIQPMHIRGQKVIYINKDGKIASDKLVGHKRRGRPPKPERKTNKPLSDVKIKRDKLESSPEKIEKDNASLDIDLDLELNTSSTIEEKPKRKRGRPRKVKTENEVEKPKRKRGRPRKNPPKE